MQGMKRVGDTQYGGFVSTNKECERDKRDMAYAEE